MKEVTLIFIIIILLILVAGLIVAIVYLVRWIMRFEKKIDDLGINLNFATDNYLINEREKTTRIEEGRTGESS